MQNVIEKRIVSRAAIKELQIRGIVSKNSELKPRPVITIIHARHPETYPLLTSGARNLERPTQPSTRRPQQVQSLDQHPSVLYHCQHLLAFQLHPHYA